MEDLAVDYLHKNGYIILERNFYTRRGEADIIALDGDVLCFIEVKYRKDDTYGTAAEAVTPRKQMRIIKTAKVFLSGNERFNDYSIRFDVLAIDGDRISLIEGAFEVN